MTGLEGKELVYLACPYAHPDKAVMLERFRLSNVIAGRLMQIGYYVFSPISHSHPIAEDCDMDSVDHDFWLKQDAAIFVHCEIMMIATIDGWKESYGIGRELEWAKTYDMPVILVHVSGDRITGFEEYNY
ncbi:MAG: DUF1937 family protein [FCB group bacterium]|nr:DUF1937 family protein [FCB group bacterium]